MDLKILFFCRLAPWILVWIGYLTLASSSIMALAMAHLAGLCSACFRITVIVTIFALIDRAHPRSNCV